MFMSRLSAAEITMRLHETERQQALRAGGGLVVREVLSKDNTPPPDYHEPDPFYSGPVRPVGGAAMQFAEIPRPDLGEAVQA
jgi:hypothetical protein